VPETDYTRDVFLIRELCQPRLLSYLGNDLRRVVRTRPLVSVAVSGDRYPVGYSVARVVLADRWCPLIIMASGPSVARGRGRLPLGHSRVE
jgi:hypothetical protein